VRASITHGGTLNILWQSHLAKVKRVVYASSSSVYGDSKKIPLKESQTPVVHKSPHALQKYTFEFNHIPSSQIPEFVRDSPHEVIVTGIIQIKTEFGPHAFHAKTDPRGELRSISERGKLLKMYPDTQAMIVSLLPKS
jgi:hypothetical protein